MSIKKAAFVTSLIVNAVIVGELGVSNRRVELMAAAIVILSLALYLLHRWDRTAPDSQKHS